MYLHICIEMTSEVRLLTLQDFIELYNLEKDPEQLVNIASSVKPNVLAEMDARMVRLSVCAGSACQGGHVPSFRTHWGPHV